MRTGWRIVKTKYAAQAFDGEGSRLYGGRWNNRGTRMVYTAQSRALAILEVLVHLNDSGVLPAYSLCAAHFDEALVISPDRAALPTNWHDYPAPPELQRLGDQWITASRSAVLEVPSTLVDGESNYLINPAHPDFSRMVIDPPELFTFDPRFFKRMTP